MDLKKGLTRIAWACFLILFDFNINLTDMNLPIDILPNFVGWILIFFAVDYLGSYITNNSFVKWTAIGMVVFSILEWYTGPEAQEKENDVFYTVTSVLL